MLLRCLLFISIYITLIGETHAVINYNVSQYKDTIHIKATFQIQDDTIGLLHIPDKIWGTDYQKQIHDIQVRRDVNKKILTIEYDVTNVSKDEFKFTFGDKYYHFFDKQKFLLFGHGLFLYPQNYVKDTDNVIINIESNLNIFCSIDSCLKQNKKNAFQLKFKNLKNLILAGDKNLRYKKNKQINLILWNWNKNKTIKSIDTIINNTLIKHKKFWGITIDENNKNIIILSNPYPIKYENFGGMVVDNNIVTFINPGPACLDNLYQLFNHEGLHFWFGKNGIKGDLWFTEGFVSYYMDKIDYYLSHDKQILTENYNTKLKEYFSSAGKTLTNQDIQKHFFNYKIVQSLPYIKGYLIAGQLDSIIDLDSTLKRMFTSCKKHSLCSFSTKFLLKNIPPTNTYTKKQINSLINDFDVKWLSDKLLTRANLKFKKLKVASYECNIPEIIKKGYIEAKILNKLTNGQYLQNKNHKILDIIKLNNNDIRIVIENNSQREIVVLKHYIKTEYIPYYDFT